MSADKKTPQQIQELITTHEHVAQIAPADMEALRAAGDHPEPLLLDVREDKELAELSYGEKVLHTPYLTKLQHATTEAEVLGLLPEELKADKDRVVIAMCRSGGRSNKTADILKAHGWKHVANMAGGMNEYQKHFPVHTPAGVKQPDSSSS